jgi:integrase
MAKVENRSRYIVSVKNNDALTREFPYSQLADASAYLSELRRQKFKPSLRQLEDTIAIRLRQKGYPNVNLTVHSVQEATDLIAQIESERRHGIIRDYTKARRVTFADLISRYMEEEGPTHKGWEKVEKYKCQGWLADLEGTRASNAMRTSATEIEWMNKPFADVETTDIESYIRDRLEVVVPATVDREVDVIAAICNIAIEVWKYRVIENPMTGVRRPRYFNERDRRLKSGELERLLAATRGEDRNDSVERRVEALMIDARSQAGDCTTIYQKKAMIKQARAEYVPQAEADYEHVPLIETFVRFQLMTAARRGETLKVRWADIDFEARSVYLAETKNGRPRKLPLRAELVELLLALPRTSEHVFPITQDKLTKAWRRIGQRAGIDDLHIHDLRHEAISLMAETGQFSLIDLQAFSGHRDVRMLLRYSHLCVTKLAHRLDQAFAQSDTSHDIQLHHGRRRLAAQTVPLSEILADTPEPERGPQQLVATPTPMQRPTQSATIMTTSGNVLPFPSRNVA